MIIKQRLKLKNKEYKGAANILNNQNIGKQFFDHMALETANQE
jgi:hypothetical protein